MLHVDFVKYRVWLVCIHGLLWCPIWTIAEKGWTIRLKLQRTIYYISLLQQQSSLSQGHERDWEDAMAYGGPCGEGWRWVVSAGTGS